MCEMKNREETILDLILELSIENYIIGCNDKSLDLSKIDKKYIKENMTQNIKNIMEEYRDDIMEYLDFIITDTCKIDKRKGFEAKNEYICGGGMKTIREDKEYTVYECTKCGLTTELPNDIVKNSEKLRENIPCWRKIDDEDVGYI